MEIGIPGLTPDGVQLFDARFMDLKTQIDMGFGFIRKELFPEKIYRFRDNMAWYVGKHFN